MTLGTARWNRLTLVTLMVAVQLIATFPSAIAQNATPVAGQSGTNAESPGEPVNAPYLWRASLAPSDSSYLSNQVATWENRIYVLEPNGRLRVFDAELGVVVSDRFLGDRPLHMADFLYVDDQYIVAGDPQRTIALDRRSGAQLWAVQSDVSAGTSVLSYPTIADGVVYMSDGASRYISDTSELFAVDLESGTELWRTTVDWMDVSPPTVIDGLIFATIDDEIKALDVATGAVSWTLQFPIHLGTILALAPGIVGLQYPATTPMYTFAVAAFDASTGALLWEVPAPAKYLASTDTSTFIGTGEWLDDNSELRAIDSQTGATIWSLPLPNESVVSAATRGNTLYAATMLGDSSQGDQNGRLLKVQAETGDLEGEAPLAQIGRSLSFAGESLVSNTSIGLLVIDSDTLLPKFELPRSFKNGLAIDETGRLFMVDQTDTLNALDPDRFESFTSEMSMPIAPAVSSLSGWSASIERLPQVIVGLWKLEIEPGGTFSMPTNIEGAAFLISGTVVEQTSSDSEERTGPFAINIMRSGSTSLTNSGLEPAIVLIAAATDPVDAPVDEQETEYRLDLLSSMVFAEPPTPSVGFHILGFDIPSGAATAPSTSLYPSWVYVEEGNLQLMESSSVAPTPPALAGFSQGLLESGTAQTVLQNDLMQLLNTKSDDARAWAVELYFGPGGIGGGCAGRCRS